MKSYTVTFYDYDNTLLSQQEVYEGESAIAPKNPTGDGYSFSGWDTDFSNVTANLIVTAMYQKDHQTGIEDAQSSDIFVSRKILIDNVIYIFRGDKTYTLQGQEVN